tara:strand:- start:1175 stop:1336 length:162 start_codon:yes stop_codon:yes gene_type:complete
MNTPRKVIWTAYLIALTFSFFSGGMELGIIFIILGWIPFLLAHFIWKGKKSIK